MKKLNVRYRVIDSNSDRTLMKPTKDRSKAFKFAREWNKNYNKKHGKTTIPNPAYVYKEWEEKTQYGDALN
jgi:hypothetical protein